MAKKKWFSVARSSAELMGAEEAISTETCSAGTLNAFVVYLMVLYSSMWHKFMFFGST